MIHFRLPIIILVWITLFMILISGYCAVTLTFIMWLIAVLNMILPTWNMIENPKTKLEKIVSKLFND